MKNTKAITNNCNMNILQGVSTEEFKISGFLYQRKITSKDPPISHPHQPTIFQ